jgi:hypothetical protein
MPETLYAPAEKYLRTVQLEPQSRVHKSGPYNSPAMVYLPQSRDPLPREQFLALARLPLSVLALAVAIRLLSEPAAMITALATQQVPLPAAAYVVAVTLYLSGALALFFGYRIALVGSVLAGLTLAAAGALYLGS